MADEKKPIDLVDESYKAVIDAYASFEKVRDQLHKEQSQSDLALAEMYHIIEGFDPTHVSQSHYLFLELQKILRRRREVKGAVAMMRAISDSMNFSSVEKTQKRAKKRHDDIMSQLKSTNKKAEKIIEEQKKK